MTIRKYRLRKDVDDSRDKIYAKRFLLIGRLPKMIDLRTSMPPVVDQGSLGSCTANAIAGALGFLEIANKAEYEPMSRLFIYYNERKAEGTLDEDAGAQIRSGVKSLTRYGSCSENIWPYEIREFTIEPSRAAYADGKNHKVTIYRRVLTPLGIKQALVEGFPVVIGIDVFPEFEEEAASKTGIVPIPVDKNNVLGGHAVLVVGYDDSKKWFIIRNSWGDTVGDKGYYYLSYEYIDKYSSDMWVIYNVGKVGRFINAVKSFIKAKVKTLPRSK